MSLEKKARAALYRLNRFKTLCETFQNYSTFYFSSEDIEQFNESFLIVSPHYALSSGRMQIESVEHFNQMIGDNAKLQVEFRHPEPDEDSPAAEVSAWLIRNVERA